MNPLHLLNPGAERRLNSHAPKGRVHKKNTAPEGAVFLISWFSVIFYAQFMFYHGSDIVYDSFELVQFLAFTHDAD